MFVVFAVVVFFGSVSILTSHGRWFALVSNSEISLIHIDNLVVGQSWFSMDFVTISFLFVQKRCEVEQREADDPGFQ